MSSSAENTRTPRLRTRRRAVLAAATAAAALVCALPAAPASAAAPRFADVVIRHDGDWKAYASYNSDTNLLCIRAYNSVSSARAVALLRVTGGPTVSEQDWGGDQRRNCIYVNLPGDTATLQVAFDPARSGRLWSETVAVRL